MLHNAPIRQSSFHWYIQQIRRSLIQSEHISLMANIQINFKFLYFQVTLFEGGNIVCRVTGQLSKITRHISLMMIQNHYHGMEKLQQGGKPSVYEFMRFSDADSGWNFVDMAHYKKAVLTTNQPENTTLRFRGIATVSHAFNATNNCGYATSYKCCDSTDRKTFSGWVIYFILKTQINNLMSQFSDHAAIFHEQSDLKS